jgi:DNA polymerase III alpha subunit (gram-positive type)
MVITINEVIKVYSSLLKGALSYADADRWAWSIIQQLDHNNLQFDPPELEELIWDLIKFLYGIDMPSITDRTKTMLTDIDIISFLKEKDVYKLL